MSAVRRLLNRSHLRQFVVGLVALPLSAVPFAAYGTFTPEGRLVRDRVRVALSPPSLPELTSKQERAAKAAAPRYTGKVMALVYHGLGSGADADGDGGFVLSPGRFGEHLATLQAAGMKAVTAGDVARAFGAGKPLPSNAVMITFDDGRTDAIMWADPLLEQAGMKATTFVISGAAADPGIYYAGWKRLRAAARSGRWDIQAHTHDSHQEQRADGGGKLPKLTSLAPGERIEEYRQRVRDDLEENSAAILEHVGRRPVAFAYPFGAYGADRANDPRIREVLRQEVAGRYALAFHQDGQDSVPLVDVSQERVGLRRLEVGRWSGLELLRRIGRAAQPVESDPAEVPVVTAPPVADLPAIPYLPELSVDPAPIPPESTFEAPAPAVKRPAPAVKAGPAPTTPTTPPEPVTTPTTASDPAASEGSTTTTGPATTTTTVAPATSTTTTKPPTTKPPTTKPPPTTTTTAKAGTTTTTRRPPTTTTTVKPPTTTTTVKPPTTTTTAKAGTTTTTRRPTTTTTICRKANGKPCTK